MMTLFDASKDAKPTFADAQMAFTLPVGAASPLWLMFAGAASAGVAYWWLSRWWVPTNLEAVLAPSPDAPLVVPQLLPAPVVEAAKAADEAVETLVEAAPEPVVEPAGEAAPESILEVAPTPKPKAPPRAKAAAVRAAPRTVSGPTRRS